jgi:CRISPR-associated protein Cas2
MARDDVGAHLVQQQEDQAQGSDSGAAHGLGPTVFERRPGMIKLVCYDIADNAARTKVSDYLENQGFDRVQYSVFMGKVDPHRWQVVWATLQKLFVKRCEPTDKIFSLVIERDHFEKMGILGHEIDRAWILQEVQVLFV